jgi:hypothetical protein
LYADYSEYFIGHSVSTYWAKKAIGKSRDIHENRALSQFFKYAPIGKAECRYPKRLKELKIKIFSNNNHIYYPPYVKKFTGFY